MFASPQLIATVERGELWTDGLLNVTPSAVLSVYILTNNIVVSFFAFCSGIVFGLGTFYLIGTNGMSLGAIFAFTGQHGLAGRLFDFVVAHGCVELSCICIAGAAGAYVGEALIRPGELHAQRGVPRGRGEGMRVLVVVTLLLFICGFIEGYVSPDPEVPRWARVTIGVGYWLFMISLLRGYVFGRSRGGHSRSGRPRLRCAGAAQLQIGVEHRLVELVVGLVEHHDRPLPQLRHLHLRALVMFARRERDRRDRAILSPALSASRAISAACGAATMG